MKLASVDNEKGFSWTVQTRWIFVICWSFRFVLSWEGLLLVVTDVSTTCVEVIFRVGQDEVNCMWYNMCGYVYSNYFTFHIDLPITKLHQPLFLNYKLRKQFWNWNIEVHASSYKNVEAQINSILKSKNKLRTIAQVLFWIHQCLRFRVQQIFPAFNWE